MHGRLCAAELSARGQAASSEAHLHLRCLSRHEVLQGEGQYDLSKGYVLAGLTSLVGEIWAWFVAPNAEISRFEVISPSEFGADLVLYEKKLLTPQIPESLAVHHGPWAPQVTPLWGTAHKGTSV